MYTRAWIETGILVCFSTTQTRIDVFQNSGVCITDTSFNQCSFNILCMLLVIAGDSTIKDSATYLHRGAKPQTSSHCADADIRAATQLQHATA